MCEKKECDCKECNCEKEKMKKALEVKQGEDVLQKREENKDDMDLIK